MFIGSKASITFQPYGTLDSLRDKRLSVSIIIIIIIIIVVVVTFKSQANVCFTAQHDISCLRLVNIKNIDLKLNEPKR